MTHPLQREFRPGYPAVGGFEKLRQVVPVTRNRPAVFTIHKLELGNVLTPGQVLLQALLRARRFPRDAAVLGTIQGSLDRSGRTGVMRFGTPYPAFQGRDEIPHTATAAVDRRGGL